MSALFDVASVADRLLRAGEDEGLGEDLSTRTNTGRSGHGVEGEFVAFGLCVGAGGVEVLVLPFGVLGLGFFLTGHSVDRRIGGGDHGHEIVQLLPVTDSRRGQHGIGYGCHEGLSFVE